MSEFAALDRQVQEARKIDEFQKTHEGYAWMDEINESRRNEQELVGKINRAGKDYQGNFEKSAGGKAFERNEKGEVTGLDFGNADDIYGSDSAEPHIAKFAATTDRAASSPASAQYVADTPVRVRSLERFEASCIDTSTAAPASSEAITIMVTSMALPRWELRLVMVIATCCGPRRSY